MNNETFLQEVLNSKLCPKNFEKIYEEFKDYQKKALDALLAFHDVCEKNKIPYVLAYGSLIGLIRDGGQIPWDYDIDVLVPYEKRKKLLQALNKDLPKNFYYNDLSNNKKCRHMFIRLAPVGFRTEALHVDIFFLTGTPKNKKERVKMVKQIKFISNIRFYKCVDIKFEGYKNPKRKLKLFLKKFQYILVPIKPLMKKYYSLCEKYPSMTSEYSIRTDIFSYLFLYKSNEIWNTTLKKDDSNHELRIPIDYEKILTDQYGDYKKIPNLNERINEVLRSHKRLIRSKINKD